MVQRRDRSMYGDKSQVTGLGSLLFVLRRFANMAIVSKLWGVVCRVLHGDSSVIVVEHVGSGCVVGFF